MGSNAEVRGEQLCQALSWGPPNPSRGLIPGLIPGFGMRGGGGEWECGCRRGISTSSGREGMLGP